MELWTIIVLIVLAGIAGVSIYNIISLIRKINHNPQYMFDLLVGVLVFSSAAIVSLYLAFKIILFGAWWL